MNRIESLKALYARNADLQARVNGIPCVVAAAVQTANDAAAVTLKSTNDQIDTLKAQLAARDATIAAQHDQLAEAQQLFALIDASTPAEAPSQSQSPA